MHYFRQTKVQRWVARVAAASLVFASLPISAATYELRQPLPGVRPATGTSSPSTPQTPDAPPAVPAFSASPTALDFPGVVVGTASTQSVVLSNSGTGAGAVTLTNPTSFGLTHDCPASLAAGASCTASVSFMPGGLGTVTDSFSLGGILISLSGTGIPVPAPVFSLSTTSLAFGNVDTGTTSTQSVTLSNTGNAAGAVSVSTPTKFALNHNCPASLAAGASCTASVTFAPSVVGSVSDSFTIAGEPVSLSGTGTKPKAPDFAVSTTTLDFGQLETGLSSTQSVTLTNNGDGAGAVAMSSPTKFSVAGNCSGQLQPGASCTANVTYAPTVTGSASETLTLGGKSVSLSGSAVVPVLRVALSGSLSSITSPTAWADETVGSAGTLKSFYLRNVGQVGQIISNVTVTGSSAFTIESVKKTSPSGDAYYLTCGSGNSLTSCTADDRSGSRYDLEVQVRFRPTTVAAHTGTLTLVHNGNAPTTLTASLNGNGIAVKPTVAVSSALTSTVAVANWPDTPVSASADQVIYLRNVGGAGAILSDVKVTGADWSIVDVRKAGTVYADSYTVTCGVNTGNDRKNCAVDDRTGSRYTLAVVVRLTPTVTGARPGSLTFDHNGTGIADPVTVDLNGNGIVVKPQVAVSSTTSSINTTMPTFTAAVGQNAFQSIYLRNVGTSGGITSDVTVSGSGFSIYEMRKTSPGYDSYVINCAGVNTGNARTQCSPDNRSGSRYDLEVKVKFTPSATGAASGSITFDHNGTGIADPITVNLTGNGT